ncbi:uncharacterized protein FTOL_11789 [Fusarium torulosum]|uniref:Uncharacterized protein n=1 Tax=Fusarium torulosum TaxID=33205 RepID=A0AAE8SNS2_9HYPO|nr:uncharacterized protein FTOL_11789 [Fusarium torulosum]
MPGYPPSISTLASILMTKGRNTTTVAASYRSDPSTWLLKANKAACTQKVSPRAGPLPNHIS